MTDKQDAVEAGKNAPESENVDEQSDGSNEETSKEQGDVPKGVQKLLSQRNEERERNEKLQEENEQLRSMVEKVVDKKLDTQERQKQINEFKANVEPEVAEKVEQLINQNPWLTVDLAYNALFPEQAAKKWQQFNFSGKVPDKVREEKSIDEVDDSELQELAKQELEAMWIRGRR